MPKAYSVNYDLKAPGRDYTGLYDEIKKSPTWWHYLESTWLVATDEAATDIWNRIRQHIDQNDSVLVVEIRKDYSGWLPQKAWDWIHQNLQN